MSAPGVHPAFEADPHPGAPRILFVGLGESSHTHAWIDLLAGAKLNVRLFALPTGVPPADWPVRTYVSGPVPPAPPDARRAYLGFPHPDWRDLARAARARLRGAPRVWLEPDRDVLAEDWLAEIVRRWRPDVIHTFGIEPGSSFYLRARRRHALAGQGFWIAQDRGPDIWMNRHLPELAGTIRDVLAACDALVCDNETNVALAPELGLRPGRLAPLGIVPSTGGVDVDALSAARALSRPAERRLVFWPKAYECPQSKALPVFEALRLAVDRLPPCEIRMTAAIPETRMWFETLPAAVRRLCRLDTRVPREEALHLMASARVMLAPSLSDGIPNTLWEAMATGALPVMSPIPPLLPLVEPGRHVLFARNLHPGEIADALVRALTDDALVTRAADENLPLVRAWADRAAIAPRVVAYYEEVAGRSRT